MIEMIMDRKPPQANGKESARTSDPLQRTHAPGSRSSAGHPPLVSPAFADELVQLFKLLSDETRLQILLLLMQENELHVRALCDLLGQSQPAVSHHLALLRVAGLIDRRREGKHNFYHLVADRFEKLLGTVFAGTSRDKREIQFKDFVLSFAPA